MSKSGPADERRRRAEANVRKYYLYHSLWGTGFWFGVWIKYLTVSRGFEIKWIFLMDLPFWAVITALEAPFGVLGDRIGRKAMMVAGQSLYAVTILGFGFVDTYPLLFADYVLWGISNAMFSGVDQALIYDSAKAGGFEARYAKIAGRGYATTVSVGSLSVLLGGFIGEWTSLTFVVRMSALFPALAAVVALTMREAPFERTGRHYLDDLKSGFRFTWEHRQIRWSIALGSVVMAAAFATTILTQPFLLDHGVATRYFGVYQAPLRLASVAAALTAHRLIAARGSGNVFLVSVVALIAAFAVLGASDSTGLFFLFAVPELVQGTVKPTMDAYINERTPSERRATILSVWSLSLSVQLALFEPALGFLTDWTSAAGALLFSAVWFAILLPPLYVLWRRADRGSPPVLANRAGAT